jgi:hypothetical protein
VNAKGAFVLIFFAILAAALLASHQRKPFELRIDEPDARPATWPTNAAMAQPTVMMCRPMVIELERRPKPIVRA